MEVAVRDCKPWDWAVRSLGRSRFQSDPEGEGSIQQTRKDYRELC